MSQRTSTPAGGGRREPSGSPRNWYQTQFALIVVSIIVAAIIVGLTWSWDEVLKKDTHTFCLPFEVQLEDSESFVVTSYERHGVDETCKSGKDKNYAVVSAEVEGSVRVIERLKRKEHAWGAVPFSVPNTKEGAGPQNIAINLEQERETIEALDRNFSKVKFLNTSSQTIEFVVESLKKDVPLNVKVTKEELQGLLPQGFQISEVKVEPHSIKVNMPESQPENDLDTLPSDSAEIEASKATLKRTIRLPENYTLAEGEPKHVEVTVKVLLTEHSFLLPPLEVKLRNNDFAEGTLSPSPNSISLYAHIDLDFQKEAAEKDAKDDEGISLEDWLERRDHCIDKISNAKLKASIDVQGIEQAEDYDKNARYAVNLEGVPDCVRKERGIEFQPEKVGLRMERNADK